MAQAPTLSQRTRKDGPPAFIGNAVAAKIFLHEKVDRRRWIAAGLVAAGVALLAG
jgi:drug/metabolite transporter (DMT)-like permease